MFIRIIPQVQRKDSLKEKCDVSLWLSSSRFKFNQNIKWFKIRLKIIGYQDGILHKCIFLRFKRVGSKAQANNTENAEDGHNPCNASWLSLAL